MINCANTIDHEARRTRLHSTDIVSLLGLPGAKRAEKEVWLEKRGMLEPWSGNKATDFGKRAEPMILDFAEDELGPLTRNVVRVAEGIDCPIAATMDAETVSRIPVEAKSTGIVGPVFGTWGDEGTDIVPELYLVQCSIQMLCDKADFAYLYSLIGGRGFVRYRIIRDDAVIAEIVERSSRWWDRCIVKGMEPTSTEPLPLDVVKRIRREPNSVASFDESQAVAVAEFEAARTLKLSAEKTCEAAQSKLLELLGQNEAATLPDGRAVTFYETRRKGFVVADTTFRTLRIKKGK